MRVVSFSSIGFDGELVSVEVDIRRGIPGIDVVGLPDGAVREAKERVRVALRNSGYSFPADRILVNLAPAGVRKEGAAFDLAIAVGILASSGQLECPDSAPVLVMGELELSGTIRPVRGVLSAVAAGLEHGIRYFIVPSENLEEAAVLRAGRICGLRTLGGAAAVFTALSHTGKFPSRSFPPSVSRSESPSPHFPVNGSGSSRSPVFPAASRSRTVHRPESGPEPDRLPAVPPEPDFADLRGQPVLTRALEIAAAGGHHVFLFGPPGCGKTMSARRFPGLLPDLPREDSIVVTRIYSTAGVLPNGAGLIRRPPFRSPHHSASLEGIIGGGRSVRPGEVSLAHKGVLFLDEAPEFGRPILQSLREPIEEGRVVIARAGASYWFPSDFQLILAANPCPCGNLGHDEKVCLCSANEIASYWKKLRGPLLDRIDLRVPVDPVPAERMLEPNPERTETMRARVVSALGLQAERYGGIGVTRNAKLPAAYLERFCALDRTAARELASVSRKLSLSSRAVHSVVRVARTIADLAGADRIGHEHLFEAIQHRRFGDGDYYWGSS